MSHLKASSATARKKINLIISNRDKYSISAMCEFLGTSRSLVYYHLNKVDNFEKLENEEELLDSIKTIFKRSKNNYGTRKIKLELSKINIVASRRKISRIIKENSKV